MQALGFEWFSGGFQNLGGALKGEHNGHMGAHRV